MAEKLQEAQESVEVRESKKRRKAIEKLIRAILRGEFKDNPLLTDKLYFTRYSPRQEYISPEERGSYDRPFRIEEMMAGTDQAK